MVAKKTTTKKPVTIENTPVVIEQHQVQLAPQQEQHMQLLQMAISNDVDIVKIERLVQLQKDWEKDNARKLFYCALSRFQSEIPIITKKGEVAYGQTAYTFAKLEDIAEAIKPFLQPNGLSYRYEQATNEKERIEVTCIITHSAGHEEKTSMAGYADKSGAKNAIQQIASTVSYLRRYTLTGGFGLTVADEDNDAADNTEPQDTVEYFSNEKFQQLLPGWMKAIQAGTKTPDRVLEYMEAKGANLSQEQIDSIQLIRKKA